MQVVPVQALPNQTFQISLGGQACQLNVYQTNYAVFMDVLVGGALIIGGVICENLVRIVRDAYLGFVGDFVWLDLLSDTNPIYTGLGTQYVLVYLEASDLETFGPPVG